MGLGAPAIILLIIALFLYFLPAIIGRSKRNSTSIFFLNLFLGWTFIGWIVAFIWAVSNDAPPVIFNNMPPPQAPREKSKADELAKLARLHSDGVLTQDEFDAEKRKLLSQ